MKIKSFYDLSEYELIKPIDQNGRDIRLYTFNNVTLTGNSGYYPDLLVKEKDNSDYLVLPLKEMTMSLNRRSAYEESGMEFPSSLLFSPTKSNNNITNNNNLTKITDSVYYFIYNTENYFHFIYDTIPYLYCFLQLREHQPNIKLLMNYNKGKSDHLNYIKEALSLFRITDKDIIIHQPNNQYTKLYLSSSLTHNGLSNSPPRKELFELYQIMINSANKSIQAKTVKKYDKLYVSRRTWIGKSDLSNIGTNYTQRRRLVNEDQLVEQLEKDGFQEIFGENYNFVEKIVLFNNAKIVVGAIGGTIINTIFCHPTKTQIICLVSPDFIRVNKRLKFPLSNQQIEYFEETELSRKGDEYANNVRVRIIDNLSSFYNKLGEIDSYDQTTNSYLIKLEEEGAVGWSEDKEYKMIRMEHKQLEPLDYGLNSPWRVDLEALVNYL